MDFKKTLGMMKQQYNRGSSWIGILLSFGIITANIKLFEGFIMPIIPSGIPFQWTYPFAIMLYVFGCYIIGIIDEHWGIWGHENNYVWAKSVSPMSREMFDDIKDIKEMVKNGR